MNAHPIPLAGAALSALPCGALCGAAASAFFRA